MESTIQTAQTSAPQASAQPMNVAPPSDSQFVSNQGQTSPAYQVQAPQMPQYQAQAQAPQASAPQGNPWQQAFQALSASMNTSNPSQSLAQQSAYQTTPTPQMPTQASWASIPQAPQQQAQYSAQQTYSPQVSTQQLQALMQQQVAAQAPVQVESQAPVRDAYLSQISDESLEVLEHFGAEAPNLLNTYACAVEDALIEQVQRGQSQSLMLQAAGEERGAMNLMLTDPDVLADYVNDFFGPEGPYPTLTNEEQAHLANEQARAQFEQEIIAQEQNQVPQQFQRPTQAMPTPGRQANAANDFWGGFSEMMDANPEDAWKVLAQAPPAAFQQKMMIQDL